MAITKIWPVKSHLGELLKYVGNKDKTEIEVNPDVMRLIGYDTNEYVLVTEEKSYLITDFRYIEATKAAAAPDFTILMPQGGMLKEVARLLGEHGGKELLTEEATLSCLDRDKIANVMGEGIRLAGGLPL